MNVSEKDLQALESMVPNATPVADMKVLENSGKSIVTYGIRTGDEIRFFTMDEYTESVESGNPEKSLIKSRQFGGGAELMVACYRNGQISLYSLSDLRRRDINLEPVGDFRKKMVSIYASDSERLNAIAGKTIKAGDIISYDVPKAFAPELDENGEPTGKNVPVKDEKGNIIPKDTKATCPEILLVDGKKK